MARTAPAKQVEWKLRALDEFRRKVSEMASDEVDTVMLEEELREKWRKGILSAPRGIRTPDLQIRSPMLYPTELEARTRLSREIAG